jgi:glutathione S-transferase
MIELYRLANSQLGEAIEAALRDMVVAYERIIVEPGQAPAELPAGTTLPAIRHDDRLISGQAALVAYLSELEQFVADWRRFQSDACYVDEDGEVC